MKIQATIILFVIMLSSCSTVITAESIETPIPILTTIPVPTSTVFPTLTAYPTSERFEFSMLSPDGTKQIQSRDWVTFDIVDIRNGEVLQSFSYDRAKFGEGAGYSPEGGYIPFHWSQNGEYIYVYAHQSLDGGVKYYGNAFGARNGLARFDLDTGIVAEILPEREGGGYTSSISPDEKGIVYVDQRETPLVLRWKDLSTGDEKALFTFDEKILDVGEYEWSPEMDKLLFMGLEVQNPGYTDGSQKKFYSFFIINLENPQPERILQGLDKRLEFNVWDTPSLVQYKDSDDIIWQLDLESKTLAVIGTTTPSP